MTNRSPITISGEFIDLDKGHGEVEGNKIPPEEEVIHSLKQAYADNITIYEGELKSALEHSKRTMDGFKDIRSLSSRLASDENGVSEFNLRTGETPSAISTRLRIKGLVLQRVSEFLSNATSEERIIYDDEISNVGDAFNVALELGFIDAQEATSIRNRIVGKALAMMELNDLNEPPKDPALWMDDVHEYMDQLDKAGFLSEESKAQILDSITQKVSKGVQELVKKRSLFDATRILYDADQFGYLTDDTEKQIKDVISKMISSNVIHLVEKFLGLDTNISEDIMIRPQIGTFNALLSASELLQTAISSGLLQPRFESEFRKTVENKVIVEVENLIANNGNFLDAKNLIRDLSVSGLLSQKSISRVRTEVKDLIQVMVTELKPETSSSIEEAVSYGFLTHEEAEKLIEKLKENRNTQQ